MPTKNMQAAEPSMMALYCQSRSRFLMRGTVTCTRLIAPSTYAAAARMATQSRIWLVIQPTWWCGM
jgi:hypothetical protein